MNVKFKRIMYEAIGILLLLFGSLLLVTGMMPVINPGFISTSGAQGVSFSLGDGIAIIISAILLGCALVCSRRAGRLKGRQ